MTMIWRYTKYPTSLLLFGILFSGCFQSDYTKLVKSELARGIRVDSILLGINLGDTQDEFFGKCFDLNKNQLITQGPSGLSVQYRFADSLVHNTPTPIRMLFSPSFDDKKMIASMELEFTYAAWAPWNQHLQSDSLKIKVMDLLMLWYGGNEFVTAKVNEKEIPVKLDCNRRLLVHIKDTQSVVVSVQDILHPKFMHSTTASEIKEENQE